MSQRRNLHNLFDFLTYLFGLTAVFFLMALILRIGVAIPSMMAPEMVEAQSLATPLPPAPPQPKPIEAIAPQWIALPPAPPIPTPKLTTQPLPYLVTGASEVNVRSGPSTRYDKIGVLAPETQMWIVGRFWDWWQIAYDDTFAWVSAEVVSAFHVASVPEVTVDLPLLDVAPPVIPDPQAPTEIDETHWVDVDLSEQRLTAYEDGAPVKSYLVSTGLPHTPTPTGQYRIWIKLRFDDMSGADYYIADVPWVMYFYQGYGLHGVTWHANFGHRMSHGCINQPNDMAEWLFNFAEVGTLVNIHE